jgi:glutathione synthase/RimK-type ligase-like ATP-grasp enzyme
MRKIGMLFGMETGFPQALIEQINSLGIKGIQAEEIKTGAISNINSLNYDVIFDRVSHEVLFYKAILKNAVINGTKVINNPFWGCADDNYLNSTLAPKIGIRVPKMVILPTKFHPPGTSSDTMRNLIYPLNWDEVFEYVGFPAYLKPNKGNGFINAYKVYNPQEFFSAYDLTGDTVMVLQETIEWDYYVRCYVVGGQHVRIMDYDPTKPLHLRYSSEDADLSIKLLEEIENTCIKISQNLGFDFNAVEFAIKDGVPFATDFLNPLPDVDKVFMHSSNFDWIVKHTADMLVELAIKGKSSQVDYNWAAFLMGQAFKEKNSDEALVESKSSTGTSATIIRKDRIETDRPHVTDHAKKRGRRKKETVGGEVVISPPKKRGRPKKEKPEGENMEIHPKKRKRRPIKTEKVISVTPEDVLKVEENKK